MRKVCKFSLHSASWICKVKIENFTAAKKQAYAVLSTVSIARGLSTVKLQAYHGLPWSTAVY